ncbi:MAG: hypothetical protein ABWK05_08060 [Pyrobaculum sp.]
MLLSVTIIKKNGVDICEGQVLARCCIENVCADVPIDADIKPGIYDLETAPKDSPLRTCLEILQRASEKGFKRLEVCGSKKSEKCPKKLAEYVLSKYGGPVLLVGFNNRVASALFSLTDGVVASAEGTPYPYEFIDVSNTHNWVEKAKVIVVAPGTVRLAEVAELIKKAREMGKPVVMYGALSTIYKDLGIEYFCPYGLKRY